MVLQKAACPPKLLVTTPSSATDQFPFPSVHSIHLLTASSIPFSYSTLPNAFAPDFFNNLMLDSFFQRMSHPNQGSNKLATTNSFDNFTIYQSENEDSIQKGTGENGAAMAELHPPQKAFPQQQEIGKPAKRAPLGEFHLNPTGNICQEEFGVKGQDRRFGIPAKKRAERFEIFVEQSMNNVAKEGGSSSTSNLKTDENGDSENKEEYVVSVEDHKKKQLELSPGKENIEPKLDYPPSDQQKEKEDLKNSSSDEYEDENDAQSDYFTAHGSLTSAEAAKLPSLSEKNLMYLCYDKDIYNWMLHRERFHRPRIGYMSKQSEINHEMRKVLIDWFVDVVDEFELSRSSFFLAVSLTDRALSKIDCPSDRLQLLGVTTILISTKIQEIYPPLMKDFVYVTDDSYTEEQVRRMEKIILKMVDYHLHLPLVDFFAEFFDHFAANNLSQFTRHLMWYFLELSTLEFPFVRFLPSRLAAAAFLLAAYCQEKYKFIGATPSKEAPVIGKIWSDELAEQLQIPRAELQEPAKALIQLHQIALESTKCQAIRKKYSRSKFCRVSCLNVSEFDDFLASQFGDV